jgi:ADP-ribose pyrophosphatase YjhB (NUDIX family)
METAKFYYQNPNAPLPNKPNHIGIVALILLGNSILMENRKDCSRWSLIGGGLEIDESLIDCLKREVKEETSLNIGSFNLFGIFSDPSRIIKYPDGNTIRSITIAFIVRVDNVTRIKVSDESHFLQFIDIQDLEKIDVVETHKHILNRFLTWDSKQVIIE